MQELNILLLSCQDTQAEKRTALQVIAELNTRYRGKLELLPSFIPNGPVDLTLALVWNETDHSLEQVLQTNSEGEKLLLRKTTRVALDLSDRSEVVAKLDAKARLDALLAKTTTLQTLSFTENSLWGVLEHELGRLSDKKLGVSSAPLSLRPRLGSTYLPRTRLLETLPDAPGHVVQLEAPYGYGKSVLAAQWAEALERENWRVLWLARDPNDAELKPLLTAALDLATDTPNALVQARLWEVPTLLVLEDLSGEEALSLILDDLQGLVLLASRTPLDSERLLKLAAAGHVTQLRAGDLAFTLEEAERLTADAVTGAALHAETLGWVLPLHVASLTGSSPDAPSLLAGIRSSLNEQTWRELLFLAALPYLPRQAAGPFTQQLVSRGLVQALETSFRLHPFIADIVSEEYEADLADTVREEAGRLPLLLQGKAFERVADYEGLVSVLNAVEAELWRQAPGQLVKWDALVKGLMTPERHWTVGTAHQRLGEFDKAIKRLFAALNAPGLSPDQQLGIMRELCVPLGINDNERGQLLVEQAQPLLDAAKPLTAARFLANAAIIYAHAQKHDHAIETAERALSYYPENSPDKAATEVNLALFHFNFRGDFDYRFSTQCATLERISELFPVQALGQRRDIGMLYTWLGDWDNARSYLEQARAGQALNPAISVEAGAVLAYLDGDTRTLDELFQTAHLFSHSFVSDRVAMYKILQALEAGDVAAAQRSFERSPKSYFATCAYVQVLAKQNKVEQALNLLDAFETPDRVSQLYLTAARYLITHDEDVLKAFLELTTAGARLLPGFIPLADLPDDASLALHYPLREVLASGRKDAVVLRQEDIPDLQVNLLGKVDAELLGDPLDLTDRQKQILTLLGLGHTRDAVAEAMWPEVAAKKQRNNLNVQLNTLRKLIEPWGVTTYLFEDGLRRLSSDYHDLTAALAANDAEAVYTLYREPFAPDIDLAPVIEVREQLREDVTALLFNTGLDAAHTDAIRYLEKVIELEPLHEEALQALLKQLVRRGRRRAARQHFEKFRDRLRGEMNLEPLVETRSILEV